ncbi:alpha/beta hydrolase [Ameyamaea chiangmaiensis]|uniref:Alpha/beta hydrolase n=2 Tax=Ameyamaea chiangmaiensis TaxID=442969 RepID=A0A850PAA3_9PROT|nr:alpha/beta hydrolase [Ameyamaea chiangmaiensis]NVN41467.1 alpha/beta hydrolase [Ameyamaea chiangmaiensis]
MLPGGAGDVGIRPDGTVRHGANFVVRTRALWAARGYAVVLADAPDDMTLRGVRSTPAYADRVAALVRLARERFGAPVFLLGTSQGSIAAMNGAAHAPPGTLAGVILSEPVSVLGGSHETVFDADPEGVRVPVLIVVNRDDRCPVAPPGAAAAIRAALSASPDVSVLSVSGGRDEDGTPCGSLSPHGYAGIETPVVDGIGRWVLSRLAARQ